MCSNIFKNTLRIVFAISIKPSSTLLFLKALAVSFQPMVIVSNISTKKGGGTFKAGSHSADQFGNKIEHTAQHFADSSPTVAILLNWLLEVSHKPMMLNSVLAMVFSDCQMLKTLF